MPTLLHLRELQLVQKGQHCHHCLCMHLCANLSILRKHSLVLLTLQKHHKAASSCTMVTCCCRNHMPVALPAAAAAAAAHSSLHLCAITPLQPREWALLCNQDAAAAAC
jgi:hypothetical protein